MNPETYARLVHDQLVAAAALGDERTRDIAAALARTAESAVRLAVIEALAEASDELNSALLEASGADPSRSPDAAGTVRTSLDAAGVHFQIVNPAPAADPPPLGDDGDPTARISLRLSESLKAEIEDAATRADLSVNTWLVRAAMTAVAGGDRGAAGATTTASRSNHRLSGWISG